MKSDHNYDIQLDAWTSRAGASDLFPDAMKKDAHYFFKKISLFLLTCEADFLLQLGREMALR